MSDSNVPRIHEAASASSALLRAVLEGVPDAVFVKDRRFEYVLVNDAFLALAGRGAEGVLGHTDDDILPLDNVARYRASDVDVFETGRTLEVEDERYVDPDGRAHFLTTTKVPLRDATGTITHVLGVVRDVTDVTDAKDALRIANEELERRVEERTEALRGAQQELLRKERLAVLGQLAGGLAHQIRNPLAAISNATSVLKRRLGESIEPDVQQAVAIIFEEVWEANRIITDLLDYARIRPPSLSPVLVSALIDAALPLAHAGEDIVVVRDIAEDLHAEIDERQMRDAVSNVLRNAVEAMPGGGTLTLEARREGELVLIAIEDTGPGISGASEVYLFEPLVTSKPLGLGLGLATAKSLIENQGGSIRCQSAAGRGARFEIRVPWASGAD